MLLVVGVKRLGQFQRALLGLYVFVIGRQVVIEVQGLHYRVDHLRFEIQVGLPQSDLARRDAAGIHGHPKTSEKILPELNRNAGSHSGIQDIGRCILVQVVFVVGDLTAGASQKTLRQSCVVDVGGGDQYVSLAQRGVGLGRCGMAEDVRLLKSGVQGLRNGADLRDGGVGCPVGRRT